MQPRQVIYTGIAISATVHLSALILLLYFTEVHPFRAVSAEPIAVELVSSAEATPAPGEQDPPKAQPSEGFDLSSQAAPENAAASAAAEPEPPEPPSTPHPDQQQADARPQPAATPALPEPDLSIKYHVILGLPPYLPQDNPGDGFDAPASRTADIAPGLITEFRRHLRSCSKLPGSIEPADQIRIKLRVLMTPDGRLAARPALIEASASAKGPALMQSAIAALEACQPYAMLPADRYGEWKVLDLTFTPQNFVGG
jgi:hypothetical protein